jgi:AAA15 family ATPase/GTPase
LDTATEKAPSRFQIIFILDELRYRYGFEVDQGVVQSEWLCCSKVNKEHTLFLRNEDGIKVTKDFEEGKGLELRTRSNALFLSTVDQLNGPTAKKILEWFNQLNVLEGSNDEQYEKITTTMLQDESIRPYLMRLIRHADLGIEDFLFDEVESPFTRSARLLEEKLGKEKKTRPITYLQISTKHLKYSDSSPVGHAILNFKKEESEGTKKFFRIAGPILDSLQKGHVVAVDELDAKLHPLLTRVIVRLFHSLDDNPKNAQLIFGTHDTNLLRYGKLRRDQIWFTEKTEQGATDLYSLAEMKLPKGKKVRKDASFEKDYIQGRYGAIPYLGEFSKLFQEEDGNDKTRQDL